FLDKLDALPFPARHLANNALYVRPDTNEMQTTVITNRGCPFKCVYCLAQQVAGAKNRYRSVENVIAELKECMNRHNIRNFLFRSDLFTQNKKWVKSLCEAILDEKLDIEWACNSRVDTINEDLARTMKKAHCWIIAFGVESGNQEILDKIDKEATIAQARSGIAATKAAGIKTSVYFLMGLPWDTPQTIKDNMRFARELEPDFLEIFYVYPFPGTPLYDIAVKEGLIKPGEIPADAYSAPAMRGKFMTLEEFQKWRRKAMRDYDLRPKYIVRTLAGIRSGKEFANYMKVGFQQLKDLVLNN
ncbi:MAG: radical SAM protein, partial [bacterium]